MSNKIILEAVRTLKLRLGNVQALEEALDQAIQSLDFSVLIQNSNWAVKACGLIIANEVLKTNPNEPIVYAKALEGCFDNLEHEQVRCRLETIDLIETLAKTNGTITWSKLAPALLEIANKNLRLDLEERGLEAEKRGMAETKQDEDDWERDIIVDPRLPIELEIAKTKKYSSISFSDFRGRVRASSSGATARIRLDSGAVVLMVHETVGWKALETSLKGMNSLMKGYGTNLFNHGHLTVDMIELFDGVLEHENRFVREVGFEIAKTLASVTASSRDAGEVLEDPGISQFRRDVRVELYHSIAFGLCDSCSQVRFKSICAARALLETRTTEETELVETILAPVVCLNRHYSAEGIRSYCQETWKAAFPMDGPKLIARNALNFTTIYLEELRTSKDDGAREAACFAIGEICSKIERESVEPFVPQLLLAICGRFQDASWGVRAAVCSASTQLTQSFPHFISSDVMLEGLFECLSDPVWSVREEAASALTSLVKMDSDRLLQSIISIVHERMSRSRVHDSHNHDHCHHADDDTNRMVFSCCSSEPNIDFRKIKRHDWQYSDGAIRLLRELTISFPAAVDASTLMQDFVLAVEALPKHFASGSTLEETIWTAIPEIAKALGKRPFKRYLDPMIPPLVEALTNQKRAKAAHAAAVTIAFLRGWVGEGVFRSRVESISPSYWQSIELNPPRVFESPMVSFRA